MTFYRIAKYDSKTRERVYYAGFEYSPKMTDKEIKAKTYRTKELAEKVIGRIIKNWSRPGAYYRSLQKGKPNPMIGVEIEVVETKVIGCEETFV